MDMDLTEDDEDVDADVVSAAVVAGFVEGAAGWLLAAVVVFERGSDAGGAGVVLVVVVDGRSKNVPFCWTSRAACSNSSRSIPAVLIPAP